MNEDQKKRVIEIIKNNPQYIFKVNQRIFLEHDVIVEACKTNPDYYLKKIPLSCYDDEAFIDKVIHTIHDPFRHLPGTIKSRKSILLKFAKHVPRDVFFQHVAYDSAYDRHVLLECVKNWGALWRNLPNEFLRDREFALAAVNQYGGCLGFLFGEFRRDKEIVLTAVRNYPYAYCDAIGDVRNDRDVCLEMVVKYNTKNHTDICECGNALCIWNGIPQHYFEDRSFLIDCLRRNPEIIKFIDHKGDHFLKWLGMGDKKREYARKRLIMGVLEELRLRRKYHPEGIWLKKMIENDEDF